LFEPKTKRQVWKDIQNKKVYPVVDFGIAPLVQWRKPQCQNSLRGLKRTKQNKQQHKNKIPRASGVFLFFL